MKLNKKHILIGSLVILSVVIIITVIYGRKTETFKGGKNVKAGPGNMKAVAPPSFSDVAAPANSTDTTSCSATIAGTTGTQIRNYTCYSPTDWSVVDPSLCNPLGIGSSLVTTCTPRVGGAASTYSYKDPALVPALRTGNSQAVATLTNPPCAYSGYSFNQSWAPVCTDANGGVVDAQYCAGLTPPTQATASLTAAAAGITAVCNVKKEQDIGWQFYHYALNGAQGSGTILGGYGGNNAIAKWKTANTELVLPPTSSANTILLPTGLSGTFLLLLIYYMSGTSPPAMNITYTTSGLTVISPGTQNLGSFSRAFNNTALGSKMNNYLGIVFTITNPDYTTRPTITFTCSNYSSYDSTYYPDLFMMQLNSFQSTGCSQTITKQLGFNPSTCRIGNLPFMSQYQFTTGSTSFPFGTSPTQISDSLPITIANTSTNVSTITIPNVSTYYVSPFAGITTMNFMLLIQWVGTAVSSSSVTVSYSGPDTTALTPLAYRTSLGLGPKAQGQYTVSNTGDNTTTVFYCAFFTASITAASTITVTNVSLPANATGDLLLLQVNTGW